MTVARNPIKSRLLKNAFPAFDDPRKSVIGKMKRQLVGGLDTGNIAKASKPKTKRPRRRRRS